jgi:transglutaminase-like putative cysteine protease
LTGVFWITVSLQRILLPELITHDAVRELLLRNADWLLTLMQGGGGADNLVFVTQLGILGWWLGLIATWNLFRHQRVLSAVVPAGVALLVNLYYSPINLSGYLLVFLVAALLLAVRIELANNETRWQMSRIRYAPDIYIDFLKAGMAFAALVILVSWAMPDVANRANLERLVRPLQRPWQTIEDTWSRMYQAVNYPGVASVEMKYGKNLSLGGPVRLSDRPIFEGQFAEPTYWRGATYDRYDGRAWTNTDLETLIIENGQWLGGPLFQASTQMTATLQPLVSGQDTVFVPPQPVLVSLPVDADISRITEDGALIEVSRIRSRVELGPRSAYRVVSAVTQAPVEMLQTDSTVYPPWVAERYLQLPESIPQRVVDLARQIAAPHGNTYDKAVAIESYLRTYPYTTEIAAPPEGADAVEYFLFDVKQGYCDYYASAMVVMLRAVGIPSRLAAGYAPGETLPGEDRQPSATQKYRILERDAHAWVEAFFPTYGWIQFEPTASQPLVQRLVLPSTGAPETAPTADTDEDLRDLRDTNIPESAVSAAQPRSGLLQWGRNHRDALLLLTGLLALAATAAIYTIRRERAFLRNPELLAGLLERVGKWATRLKIPWPASHTPLEHAAHFGQRVPEATGVVSQMAALLVAQLYGRQRPSSETLQTVVSEWQGLQPALWKRWLQRAAHTSKARTSKTAALDGRSPWRQDPDLDQS